MLVVVLLLGVAGYAADSYLQSRELDRLVARASAAQSQIAYSQHRVQATVTYTRPLLFGATVSPSVRGGLAQLVQDAAATQVAGLQQERRRVAGTSVLAWHRSRQRARAALLSYLDVRIAYLRGVARDIDTLFREHRELQPSFDAALKAFRTMSGQPGRHRIEVVFAGGISPA